MSGVDKFDELVEKIEDLPTLYHVDLLNKDTYKNTLLLEDIVLNMDEKFRRRFASFCRSLDAQEENIDRIWRNIMKKTKIQLLILVLAALTFVAAPKAKASMVDEVVSEFCKSTAGNLDMETIQDNHIIAKWSYRNTCITDFTAKNYANPCIDIQGFEIQVCTDQSYPADKVHTYKAYNYKESADDVNYQYSIPVSVLGKNGGRLYARVRAFGQIKADAGKSEQEKSKSDKTGDVVYSAYQSLAGWRYLYALTNYKESMQRDYCEYVKINKTNLGGMYSLMKKGYYGCSSKGRKKYYDRNQDGWLDPSEIKEIIYITNYKYTKSKSDGKYYPWYGTEDTQCKVSNLQGLKYLPWVSNLQIRDFTASKMDLSKYGHINRVDVRELYTGKFQLIAPTAKEITVESEIGGSWGKAKLSRVDVSRCKAVIMLTIGGSYYKKVKTKLPTAANNMRYISLAYNKAKTIQLNKYRKLELAYFYSMNFTKCKIDKCTKLKYVYFYCSNQIRSVNLKKSKGLKGGDICGCKRLTPAKIKTAKKIKITTGKGRWWEMKKGGRKILQGIYALIAKQEDL